MRCFCSATITLIEASQKPLNYSGKPISVSVVLVTCRKPSELRRGFRHGTIRVTTPIEHAAPCDAAFFGNAVRSYAKTPVRAASVLQCVPTQSSNHESIAFAGKADASHDCPEEARSNLARCHEPCAGSRSARAETRKRLRSCPYPAGESD